jgi:hypothetical protein
MLAIRVFTSGCDITLITVIVERQSVRATDREHSRFIRLPGKDVILQSVRWSDFQNGISVNWIKKVSYHVHLPSTIIRN